MKGGIFINYRRDDTIDFADRLRTALARYYPEHRIFLDIAQTDPGENYREKIERRLADCTVLIPIIGPKWLDLKGKSGDRRIDEPDDLVRREIELAIEGKLKIIPVFSGGAGMPDSDTLPPSLKAMSHLHGIEIRSSRVGSDVRDLVEALEPHVGPPMRASSLMTVLFGFSGRINRAQYWLAYLGLFLFVIVLTLGLDVLLDSTSASIRTKEAIATIALIPFWWPTAAVVLKRCHDFGQGWALCALYLGLCALFTASRLIDLKGVDLGLLLAIYALGAVIGSIPGHREVNDYGPPPRDAAR